MEEIMSDKEEISKVIQTYIDGMNFSSAEKTKAAFHQNASIVGYLHGDFMEMTLADFSGFVLSQQPSPHDCLLYTSPSPRDSASSRMPSSA